MAKLILKQDTEVEVLDGLEMYHPIEQIRYTVEKTVRKEMEPELRSLRRWKAFGIIVLFVAGLLLLGWWMRKSPCSPNNPDGCEQVFE